MYTTGYTMVDKQGYKGLGLGINEQGIKKPIHSSPKQNMHGIGFPPSQFEVADLNYHPPLHILLPTPTLDHPDTPVNEFQERNLQTHSKKPSL